MGASASSLIAEEWIEYGFGTLIIMLRLITRVKMVGFKGLAVDDFLIIVAWVWLHDYNAHQQLTWLGVLHRNDRRGLCSWHVRRQCTYDKRRAACSHGRADCNENPWIQGFCCGMVHIYWSIMVPQDLHAVLHEETHHGLMARKAHQAWLYTCWDNLFSGPCYALLHLSTFQSLMADLSGPRRYRCPTLLKMLC